MTVPTVIACVIFCLPDNMDSMRSEIRFILLTVVFLASSSVPATMQALGKYLFSKWMNRSISFTLAGSCTLALKAETKVISHHQYKQLGILLEPLLMEVRGTGQPRFQFWPWEMLDWETSWLTPLRASLKLLELWWDVPWDWLMARLLNVFPCCLTSYSPKVLLY